MKLRITGRHMDITPALKSYVETRFGRLDRYGLKVGSLQVVLGVEKLQHKAKPRQQRLRCMPPSMP
jgi:putative sigma-54 modulation protein